MASTRSVVRRLLPPVADVVLAVAAAVFVLVATVLRSGAGSWLVGGGTLILVGSAAVAWRTRAPVTVLLVEMCVVAPYYWLGFPDGPASILVAIATYTVASRLSWPRAAGVGVVQIVGWFGAEQVLREEPPDLLGSDHYVWIVVVVSVGVAVGAARRARSEAASRLEEQTARRVEQERLRIAREVHDVVSHSLAMIAVQAGVGAHVADRDPGQAQEALLRIKTASSDALAELRTTLRVLREPGSAAPADAVGPCGMDRLQEVVRAAEVAGLRVAVHGSAGELPASIDQTAFRIVQEAVTNTVRHARDARTLVIDIDRSEDALRLRVADDGRPRPVVDPGQGLRGAGERARAVGGWTTAGFGGDGFVVDAEIPLAGTVR